MHDLVMMAVLVAAAPVISTGYEQTLAEVAALNDAINAGEPVRGELFDALARLPSYAPTLAEDPDGRAVRSRAQLNLARTYLAEDDLDSAAGIMDEVLRSTIGEALPVAELGPSIVALHDARVAALREAGTGSVEVECGAPCNVYINERLGARSNLGLYLGVYRIWVEAADARLAATSEPYVAWVRLARAGERAEVLWHPGPVAGSGAIGPASEAPPTAPPRRAMAKAAEVTLLVLGGGMALAGGAMLGLAAHPQPGCETMSAGVVLSGLGGVALLVGGISLAVDEVRVGERRGTQALLGWRAQF